MNKKVVIAIIVVLLIVACCVYNFLHKEQVSNDGTIGEATFENLTHDTGYGLDIDEGEFPIEITLTKGELNIKISNGEGVIFEETNIKESTKEVVNVEKQGYYIMTLSGKNATGTIKYPVAESSNTPDIIEDIDAEIKETADNETFKTVFTEYFVKNDKNIEEVKIEKLKVYTEEEKKDPIFDTYELNEKDIVFDVEYSLRFKEGTEDLIKYTAATGEVDGNWVINKSNCGVVKYDESTGSYSIKNLGTGW